MADTAQYALIVDGDASSALSVRHLFQVICGQSAEILENPDDLLKVTRGSDWPQVIVLGRVPDQSRVISELKAAGAPFVIALVPSETDSNEIEALLAGADDAVRTPFSLRVLAARLRTRIGLLDTPEGLEILRDADSWDSGAYIAHHAGLTSAEAQIAHVLISHSGDIVSRDVLSFAIDQRPWDYGDRKFDVHVANIRKKLTAVFGDHIAVSTVRAAGYKLTIDTQGMQHLLS
ncbi:MAG: response regulator transcription factor [Cognatishimia sp.]|uniref:response regulator transcription factor n=1 Tax=Cognatishimia sp. TaxID=2211648 RepID=UPI003B8B8E51